MKRNVFTPEHKRLRQTIADHLRQSRRLRHVEPELSREHRALADLYKRHIDIELEFGSEKARGFIRTAGFALVRNG